MGLLPKILDYKECGGEKLEFTTPVNTKTDRDTASVNKAANFLSTATKTATKLLVRTIISGTTGLPVKSTYNNTNSDYYWDSTWKAWVADVDGYYSVIIKTADITDNIDNYCYSIHVNNKIYDPLGNRTILNVRAAWASHVLDLDSTHNTNYINGPINVVIVKPIVSVYSGYNKIANVFYAPVITGTNKKDFAIEVFMV